MTPLERDYHQRWLDDLARQEAIENRWVRVAAEAAALVFVVVVIFVAVALFAGVDFTWTN